MRRLLLVSTSTTFGTGYLDHCAEAMRETLEPCKQAGRDVLVPRVFIHEAVRVDLA